jgi:hypothetical protein
MFSGMVSTPNSTKWLPEPEVPSWDQAFSRRSFVTGDTDQSRVEDGVAAAVVAVGAELGADAEAGLGLDGLDEAVAAGLVVEVLGGEVEDGDLDAACDVDADGVGDDGVLGGEDAPDGEAVAEVGVGHEGAGACDGEVAGGGELVEGLVIEVLAGDAPELVGGAGGHFVVSLSTECGCGDRARRARSSLICDGTTRRAG